MFKKLFLCAVLGLVALEFASALQCYTCTNVNECQKPWKVSCSNATATSTSIALSTYYSNVPIINGSTYFQCSLDINVYSNKKQATHILGCTFPQVNVCGLSLRPQYYGQYAQHICKNCSGNLCNKNPAGTYSSSLYTVIASVMGLMMVKIFA